MKGRIQFMNSMSRRYQDECKKDYRRDYEREEKEEKCPTIIKCGCPSSTSIAAGTTAGNTFTLASLTLDTSCLCDPSIKLEFASNMIVPAGLTTGAINIQIFKQCRNQITAVPVGPVWTFIPAAPGSAETFSFFIWDSDSCFSDCCTYTAVARVTVAIGGAALAINNSTIGAIATCKSNECERDCRKKHRKCHCDCDWN